MLQRELDQAVREIIEMILNAQNKWAALVAGYAA
jgi:3-deoxy-D-manno-octulosonate 8-phosphate phosphatase KdsC-like HAD superfamily phosphatase